MATPLVSNPTAAATTAPHAPTRATDQRADDITARVSHDLQRASTLQVIVKTETPLLPRAAFTLITLASLGGAFFTGTNLGLGLPALLARWFGLWTMGLAGGFLIWRLAYLRRSETEVDQRAVDILNADLLHQATRVGRVVAALVALGAVAPWAASYLDGRAGLRITLTGATLLLAAMLAIGLSHRLVALLALAATAVLLVGWAWADVGPDWHGAIRLLHLTAFSLWLGGALWNIFVAMAVGRRHPDVDSVIVGARQLDRFRWVVRFSLPTIIITGLVMAEVYRALPLDWWWAYPGLLIPLKVLTIVALVVIFITCPLFRQCSPVQGVCNVDDLDGDGGQQV